MIHLFLTDGFEEIEAITTLDILRRCGLQVQTISLMGPRLIRGAHGIPLTADDRFQRNQLMSGSDALILPGGMPGAKNLLRHEGLRKVITTNAENGTLIAAICAAPMVLGENRLLEGRRATCYPGFENHLIGAEYVDAPVVEDGNFITGRGPAAAAEFAFAIAARFVDAEEVAAVRQGMLFEEN